MFDDELTRIAGALVTLFAARGLKLATAESCTGGLVAALLTEIPGSSAVVDCSFVTYSNAAKRAMLGVPADLLDRHGAVSREVALAMAGGAIERSSADAAVSITGIAGPGGGSEAKPVGLVHFAARREGGEAISVEKRFGDLGRPAVRRAALIEALNLLRRLAA